MELAKTAETALADGRYGEAERAVDALARLSPDSATTLTLQARMEVEMCSDGPAAHSLAERAVAADPKNPEAEVVLGDAIGIEAIRDGMWKAFRSMSRVRAHYDKALELDPKNCVALGRLVLVYEAVPGLLGGDKKKAKDYARALTTVDPVMGHLTLAQLARREKNDVENESEIRAAMAAEPESAAPYRSLSERERQAKRWAEAEAAAREAIRREPGSVQSRLALIECFRAQRRCDAASAACEEAIAACGAEPLLLVRSTECGVEGTGGDGLSFAAARLERFTAGLSGGCSFRGWSERILGDAYGKLDRKDEAERAYRAALAVDPNDDNAKKGLKALHKNA